MPVVATSHAVTRLRLATLSIVYGTEFSYQDPISSVIGSPGLNPRTPTTITSCHSSYSRSYGTFFHGSDSQIFHCCSWAPTYLSHELCM